MTGCPHRRLRAALILACMLSWPEAGLQAQSCAPPNKCGTAPSPPPVPAPAADDRAVLIDRMRASYARADYRGAQLVALRLHVQGSLDAQGPAEGTTMLGQLDQEGRLGPRNYERAAEYYAQAIRKAFPEAMRRLGLMHLDKRWPASDPKIGLERLSEAADKGDAEAVYQQGRLYRQGLHVERNLRRAMALFRKAGDAGVADAYAELGEIYVRGDVGRHEFAQGKDLIQKAYAARSRRGVYAMAMMVYSGQARPQSIVAAADYNAAAVTEYADAQAMLKEAAAKGEPPAMLVLASMSLLGQGGPVDPESAYRWLRTALDLAALDTEQVTSATSMLERARQSIGPARASAIDREIEGGATKR
jgi:TPR repeat protein